jgi:hypothetical protein
MRKVMTIITGVFFIFSSLQAQYYKRITVKAGTKVIEEFPPEKRYLYPQFTDGKVFMKSGVVNEARLNYNLLLGEIEFVHDRDTLVIARKKDVNIVTVAQDTFIYRSTYLKLIHSGTVKVCLRDKIVLKDIVKKGAMGTPNRTSSVDSYTSLPLDGKLYELVPADDMEFQRNLEFYIIASSGEMVEFRKKNVIELFPEEEDEIQKYLKSNKVNFESQEDIIRFADFLAGL